MLAKRCENRVIDLDVKCHLRCISNDQLLDRSQQRMRRRFAWIALDHRIERIQFGLDAAGGQKIRRVVLVFVGGAGQQRHGANGQLAQPAAGRQAGAHRAEVNIPAARQRLAP